jgi:predicted nucleotide-binding protein
MASKRTPPPKPERPQHTVQQKLGDIEALQRRIKEVEQFDPTTVRKRYSDLNVQALETAIDETLSDIFGNGSDDYQRYRQAASFDNGPLSMNTDFGGYINQPAEAQHYAAEGKERSLTLLKQAVKRLTEEIDAAQRSGVVVTRTGPAQEAPAAVAAVSRRIFIVHGRDGEMREAVARFIGEIGFEPVILHEQANGGRTVIEKFEAHSEPARFAVVLLSGEDEGRLKGTDNLAPRARQNVILELGYFVGKLTRARVCALKRGDLEVPSDIVGVVFEPYDDAGAWKQIIARELQAAGYVIDWNKVMRR